MNERNGSWVNAVIVGVWYVIGMAMIVAYAQRFGVGFVVVAGLVVHVVAISAVSWWLRGGFGSREGS